MKQLGIAVAAGILAFAITGWVFPEKVAILQIGTGPICPGGSGQCAPVQITCWDGSVVTVGSSECPPKVVGTRFSVASGLTGSTFVFLACLIALYRREVSELASDIKVMDKSRMAPPDW